MAGPVDLVGDGKLLNILNHTEKRVDSAPCSGYPERQRDRPLEPVLPYWLEPHPQRSLRFSGHEAWTGSSTRELYGLVVAGPRVPPLRTLSVAPTLEPVPGWVFALTPEIVERQVDVVLDRGVPKHAPEGGA